MKALLLFLFAGSFVLPTAAQTKPVLFPRLSKTLDSLAVVDQDPMQEMMRRGSMPDSAKKNLVARDLEAEEKANFARHQPILERIIKQYGFPGFKQVGKKSSSNFWLLVQHADAHPDFQRKVLGLMLLEVKKKNASPVNYAYLTDRVAINSGQLEEYGTQVVYEGPGIGKATPKLLRDPKKVDERRAAIGMESLESYLGMMNKMHEEMNVSRPAPNQ